MATDAARWALRMASPVTLVYRRDREDMPAYPDEVEAAMAEGIDFVFRSAPVAFDGDPLKGVRQIRIQATCPEVPGEDARRSFNPVPGTEKAIPAGTVILALGQEKGFEEWTKVPGISAADPAEGRRLADRIYAAGDMVTGPATVVEAVAAGINCAREILREVFA